MNPRHQGDLGEQSAVEWLWSIGARVFFPFGHSPDIDLVADMPDSRLLRIQVKTCTRRVENGRYHVMICTRGGNQSWNGLVKKFSSERCDALLVVVADGRRWLIPSEAVEGGSEIVVGGPRYAEFEVERGRPILALQAV